MNCFKSLIILFLGYSLGVKAQTHTPISLPSLFRIRWSCNKKIPSLFGDGGRASTTVKIVGSWSPEDTTSVVVDENGRWKGKN